MTDAPAPFPPELETAITTALGDHVPWWDSAKFEGGCRACPDVRWGLADPSGHTAHLAAVVKEVIAQHTTTEWAVTWADQIDDPRRQTFETREDAIRRAGLLSKLSPAVAIARLVLPWQEVRHEPR